jgi:predicted DNA-binding transcriptional regulator YafY
MSLKLDNLIRLFDFLGPNLWRTAEQVADELEVDRRTVFRYMREIELAFSPVPVIESSREGYRLCKNDFLDLMQSRDDYAGLAAVMSTPLGSLVQPEHPLPARFVAAIQEIIETRATLAEKILRPLFEAMRTGCYLELSYRAKEEAKLHRCVPVKFFLRTGIPYVVCYDEAYGHLIVLAADKIERASRSRKILPPAELKELRTYVNSAWGLMIRHKEGLVSEIEFQATPAVAAYFEKAPLHKSQRSVAAQGGGTPSVDSTDGNPHSVGTSGGNADGRATFRLTVHNEGEFIRYLLRFGKAVRIVSPRSAVSELSAFLSSMMEFYENKRPIEP